MPARLPPPDPLVLPLLAAAAVRRAWLAEAIASLQLAALLALLWLGLFGGKEFVFGTPAILVAVVATRLLAPLPVMHFSPTGLVLFAVHFTIGSIAGGVDVAVRALHWRCPLERGTWPYAMRLQSGQGRRFFIGCIGLLPGTVGQRVQGDQLWVHSIAGDPQRSLAKLEQRIAAMHGIRLPGEVE